MKTTNWIVLCASFVLGTVGCVSDPPKEDAAKVMPLEVGAILPLTGPAAYIGESINNGIRVAEERHPQSIKVIYEDCQADPKAGIAAYRRLKGAGVNVFIPTFTGVTNALIPLSMDSSNLLLATSVSASGITASNPNLFRHFIHANGDADLIAKHAVETMALKSIGVLYVNDDFGKDYMQVFKNAAVASGGSIPLEIPFDKTEMDFKNIMLKVKANRQCEAFYIVSYDKNLISLLSSYVEARVGRPVLSIATIGQPNVREALKALPGPLPTMVFTTTAFENEAVKSAEKAAFATAYLSKFGKAPDYFAAFSYDVLNILAVAHEKSPHDLKRYLHENKFTGVMGEITFDTTGDASVPMQIDTLNVE